MIVIAKLTKLSHLQVVYIHKGRKREYGGFLYKYIYLRLTIFFVSLPVDLSLVSRLQEEILLPEVERQICGQNSLFDHFHHTTVVVRTQTLEEKRKVGKGWTPLFPFLLSE